MSRRTRGSTGRDVLAAYDTTFYRRHAGPSAASARKILPILLDALPVESVVDVGCGRGEWLAAAQDLGVSEVLGIDGPHVDPSTLEIRADDFVSHDLERPLEVDSTFDLAVSVEVAEHLSPGRADGFVRDLVALAPVVLFSAAIPAQGGVHHVNEQWPVYWLEAFARHGYEGVDCIRLAVWDAPEVRSWYAQNVLVYASPGPALEALRALPAAEPAGLPLVHPAIYHRQYLEAEAGSLRKYPGRLLRSVRGALRRRMPQSWRRPPGHCEEPRS